MQIRIRNTRAQYGLIAQLLHWVSVILLVILIVTANEFAGLQNSPDKMILIMQHASWGLWFLLIMLLRLYWRTLNLNPVHSYCIASWHKFGAIFLHRLIYAVLVTQSITGLSNLLFSGHDISFFGVFNIPSFTINHEMLSDITACVHYMLSVVIYPLIAIHISAAIYNQLFGVLDQRL